MATSVVSGRVDTTVRTKADAYIKAAGLTPADVIKTVWENIAATGMIPTEEKASEDTVDPWDDFMEFCKSLPPAPQWFNELTDEQMKDMLGDKYAEL